MPRQRRVPMVRMTDLSSEGWCEPVNAVDFLDWEISRRRGRDPDANDWLDGMDDYQVVKLPLEIADTVLECAKRGMPSRGRPRDSIRRKSHKENVALFACVYKAELVAGGMKATGANSAEERAAGIFGTLLRRHFGIAIARSTFKREMQRVPSELVTEQLQPGSDVREIIRGMMQRIPE